MSETTIPTIYLILSDFLVLLSIVLGLYVFALNPRNLTNRLVSGFILLMTLTNLGIVLAYRAADYQSARIPFIMISAVLPTIYPSALVVSLLLAKPEWFKAKRKLVLYVLLVGMSLSGLFTIFDQLFGTNLYYTGIQPAAFNGKIPPLLDLAGGMMGLPIILINVYITPLITFIPLIPLSFFDKSMGADRIRVARQLLIAQILAVSAFYLLPGYTPSGVEIQISTSVYIVFYAYLTFQHQISDRRTQNIRLQPRLTALVLIVTLPTLIYLGIVTTSQTQRSLLLNADTLIADTGTGIAASINQWLDLNSKALQALAAMPATTSLDPTQQLPTLKAFQTNFPYMYLVSTTDAFGQNVARSDERAPMNYADRLWYQNAIKGEPITFQTLVGRTSGTPALVASTPIRNAQNQILGTVMFATELMDLGASISEIRVGETGFAYVVDERGYLVAHPGLSTGEVQYNQFAFVGPVDFVRRGNQGIMDYRDSLGVNWHAYAIPLPNNWVIVVQQQRQEILQSLNASMQLSWSMIGAVLFILFLLTWATMRQAFKPFKSLTDTAQAIARGDLKRVAPIESDDEFGVLARSFNSMTAQLVDLIDSLEVRVQERTHDLERRSAQLKAATEVGRAVATLHDLDRLLTIVTRLISESFGFYHVGIFLLDDQEEYAILRAANSTGGQKMLLRGHSLRVGQQGIVGYVTQRREPRIALNVIQDSAHYVNPDLPDTRSEMALPLLVGGKLIGALDVQSVEQNAFSQQDVETLQVLADQVAIAISNAKLIAQTQELLQAERRAYGEITHQNWMDFIQTHQVHGYARQKDGLHVLQKENSDQNFITTSIGLDSSDAQTLLTPIQIRGETIGILRTRKPENAGRWTQDEIELMENMGVQLGVALESARAHQETQLRTKSEQIASEVSASLRQSLDMEVLLRTAAQEVRRSLGIPKVLVQLTAPASAKPQINKDNNGVHTPTNGNGGSKSTYPGSNNPNGKYSKSGQEM
jgi:GAF domain-containing protein/HAMP domain-containing protein